MPPTCSIFSSTTSLSQSRRVSLTFCTWPDSSPLRHSLLRERDQYTPRPVRAVSSSASRFIHATIRISPLAASCAIAGTSPCASHLTVSSQFVLMPCPNSKDREGEPQTVQIARQCVAVDALASYSHGLPHCG